jgi:hypothetical protein
VIDGGANRACIFNGPEFGGACSESSLWRAIDHWRTRRCHQLHEGGSASLERLESFRLDLRFTSKASSRVLEGALSVGNDNLTAVHFDVADLGG